MGQLPLTFGKGRSPPPGPPPERPVLGVQALLHQLRGRLEEEFRFVLVKGEVSNCTVHRSGHVYFTLKEAQAQVRCTLWRDQRARLRFQLKDGLTILVRAKVTVFDRGDLQLNVLHAEPIGQGALQQAFLDLLEKLKAEGLTAPEKKRPIPAFPGVIGVVTSKTGAALRDVLRTLYRRHPGQSVIVAPTEVQGQGAGAKVAHAIQALGRVERVELILVVRGGGSLEDLWAFNEEGVARAIVGSRVPVITGVGHETDTTIADWVADRRASTPTAAAELAVQERAVALAQLAELRRKLGRSARQSFSSKSRALLLLERRLPDPRARLGRHAQSLDGLLARAERRLAGRLQKARQRLHQAEEALGRRRPERLLQRRGESLRQLEARLQAGLPAQLEAKGEALLRLRAALDRSLQTRLAEERHALEKLVLRLEPLSPLAVLGRGYALVTDDAGAVVRRAGQVEAGQRLRVRLAEGTLQTQVLSEEEP